MSQKKRVNFFTAIGQNTGVTAANLETFAEKLQEIDIDSVKFQSQRGDFQEWIQQTVGDYVLAKEIHQTSNQLSNEGLREKLLETIKARIKKLKRLHSEIKTSKFVSPASSAPATSDNRMTAQKAIEGTS